MDRSVFLGEGLPGPDVRNEWDVRLNDAMPMDLSVQMGRRGGRPGPRQPHLDGAEPRRRRRSGPPAGELIYPPLVVRRR
jgi:hypothetical protein